MHFTLHRTLIFSPVFSYSFGFDIGLLKVWNGAREAVIPWNGKNWHLSQTHFDVMIFLFYCAFWFAFLFIACMVPPWKFLG